MEIPETKYAKSGDVMVAYQVTGEGHSVDMVWAPGTVSHLDMDWDEANPRREAIPAFSAFTRLIRFDKRGTGLSDRPTTVATLEERTDDIRAVMDAAGSERAVLFGLSEGANMACVFAATYPERTRALILWGAQARWTPTADYPWGITREETEREIAHLEEHGITEEYLTGSGAGLPPEQRVELDWWLRYFRAGASPTSVAALERMNLEIDTRSILPMIRVPTLVMNRTGDPVADVDAARDLADHIPEARFVEFPGDSHQLAVPDLAPVLGEIQEFVTGERPILASDRVLATVLFTDIVDSTARSATMGDRDWRKLREQHDRVVREQLSRHRGREIKTMGDGFLATFDGPARAVYCAQAIAQNVRPLGIEVRSGLHTGEIELDGDDVAGLAVAIGARVSAKAGPSEVLISQTVKDLTAGSGLALEDAGEHELKGVPDRWHLYRVVG